MKKNEWNVWCFAVLSALVLMLYTLHAGAEPKSNIHQATLMEPGQKTPEISTEELRKILVDKSAIVFDARPFKEFAISHIPGAIVLSAKPGVEKGLYVSDVADVGSVLKGNKATPIVLYCNGVY